MSIINEKTVMAAAVAGALGLVAVPAQALDAEISGHLNRAIMMADDGENSDTMFVDGEPSNTRIRFVGTQEVSPGLEAGVYMEWEYVTSNSSDVAIGSADTPFEINERHFDASLAGDWGKISLGQGNGAANGAMEVDLSGTAIAAYSGAGDVGGSIEFVDGAVGTGVTIGNSFNQYDFLSRYDRIRYDSPSIGPVKIAVATGAIGAEDATDAAVRYSGDIQAGQLAVAVGYSTLTGTAATGSTETVGGSASLLMDSGLNVTVGISNRSNDAPSATELDSDSFYGKVGYKSGQNAMSVDFGSTSDFNAGGGADGDFIGAQFVHKPVGWMELYAAAKQHSVDLPGGTNADDISILFVGTRIKF